MQAKVLYYRAFEINGASTRKCAAALFINVLKLWKATDFTPLRIVGTDASGDLLVSPKDEKTIKTLKWHSSETRVCNRKLKM